jgi:subtilisin family serine protease
LIARKFIAVPVLVLAAAVPAAARAEVTTSAPDHRYLPGEALVIYAPGTDASERRELRSAADVDFEESLLLARTQVVSFDGPVREAVVRLEDQPGVVDAQPNYIYHALAAAPNDTHFGHLWGLGATPGVGALPGWDRSLGAGQVIAVVDTGVDLTHPDLVPNLWNGPGGIHGYDFVEDDDVPDDFNLHGPRGRHGGRGGEQRGGRGRRRTAGADHGHPLAGRGGQRQHLRDSERDRLRGELRRGRHQPEPG